jgi:hypothetical protein
LAADKLMYASGNSSSTTLASGVSNTDTSQPLTSDTNFAAKSGEGMVILDEGAATEELAYATGASGGALTTPLANRGLEGGSAQAHAAGATVKGILSAGMWNNLIDALILIIDKTTGLIKSGITFTTPIIASIYQDAGKTKLMTLPNTASDTLAAIAATQTFTNKRVTPRVVTATNYTTDTGTSLNCDTTDRFIVTAQAGALKFNNPSGTPTDGQTLWIAVTGTAARALTYDTQFEASAAVALPTTTVTTARLDIGFVWSAATGKWRCVASA